MACRQNTSYFGVNVQTNSFVFVLPETQLAGFSNRGLSRRMIRGPILAGSDPEQRLR